MARFETYLMPIPESGCIVWMGGCERRGYGWAWFRKRQMMAHRVAWILNFGEIPLGMCVCHKCDVPSCVRPDHLFLGTHSDNNHDMQSKGRLVNPKGEKHGRAKLTEKDVIAIKTCIEHGISLARISRNFNIGYTAVWNIAHHKRWNHLFAKGE